MKSSNSEIREELKVIREEIMIKSITEIEYLRKNFQENEIKQNEEKKEINEKVHLLEKRLEEQKRKSRCNNVIIKGL